MYFINREKDALETCEVRYCVKKLNPYLKLSSIVYFQFQKQLKTVL